MTTRRPFLQRALASFVVAATLAAFSLSTALPSQAAPRQPTLKVRIANGVLEAQMRQFPPRRQGRVRVRVRVRNRSAVKVVKVVKTNRNGRARVRMHVPEDATLRVVAAVGPKRQTTKVKPSKTATETTTDTTTTTPPPPDAEPTPVSPQGPFGPDDQYVPAGDVEVAVGQLQQQLLEGYPEGTRFVIAPGVHRIDQVLRPKARQQLLGRPGAVLDGSKIVNSFTRQDGLWVSGGHHHSYADHGLCVTGYDACGRTEAVFVDGVPLWQVTHRSQLSVGRFVFDRATGEIVLYDDPAGRLVELTVASAAVAGRRSNGTHADGVVVRNLVVRKFATMAQRGALDSEEAAGWTIERNHVHTNSGAGVIADSYSVVRGNRISDNGQLGLGGHGDSGLVEGNEIAHNHTNGFDMGWEAGGTKWSHSRDLQVRGNYVHHNDGPGLWTDINNIRTTYADNIVSDNTEAGIFHEISYDAVITGNTISRNGFRDPRWGYGAGIQIAGSPNVTITDNIVDRNARGITLIQQARGTGLYGPHEISNAEVARNTVIMETGFSGLVQDIGDLSYFTSRNNRFHDNTYRVTTAVAKPFEWNNGLRSPAEWAVFHPSDGAVVSP